MNKKLKALVVAICAGIGATLYRMGGSGNFPRQARVIGVPLLSCLVLSLLRFNWWVFLCIPLMIGAISTYFKKKGTDAKWWNWCLHGIALSLACLPYSVASGRYVGFALRSVILPTLITLWSEKIDNSVWEEFGRGFFIIITLPLLLI